MSDAPPTEQVRSLGLGSAVLLVSGNMIGVGIFLFPGVVAARCPSTLAFLGLWVLGGIWALCGALAEGKLAERFPRAGGDYVFQREAFGSPAAVVGGLLALLVSFSGAIATMSTAITKYQGASLLGPVMHQDLLGGALPFPLPLYKVVAIAIILSLTWLNTRQVRWAALFQNLITLPALVLVLVLSALLLVLPVAPEAPLALEAAPRTDFSLATLLAAMLPVYFAYTGWNALVYIGGEVKDPKRTLRRGLFIGTAVVTVVYLVVVGGLVSVLGFRGLAGAPSPASAAFALLLGPWAGLVLDLLIILAVLGTINATIMTGSRIYYAMAKDKVFLQAAGVLDPATGSPRFSLWLQAAWASLLVLPAATDKLLSYTTTAMIALSMLSVGAVLKLRRDANPAPALIYLLISAAVLAGTVLDQGFLTALAAPAAAALLWLVIVYRNRPQRGSVGLLQ